MEAPNAVEIPLTLEPGAVVPTYQTAHAAGADLCCSVGFDLHPTERKLIPTGVRVAIPPGFEGQVRPRSGLAINHGIALVNSPGTIDSDYRGEIKVIMINLGRETVQFTAGDRIAQLVICPVLQATFVPVERLDETERGSGGFGSTGS